MSSTLEKATGPGVVQADPRQVSLLPAADASGAPGLDASQEALGDASYRARADASAPAGVDASPLGRALRVRICDWCRGPIPLDARRDSICCSVRCRQARHRFHRVIARAEAALRPVRLCYVDPPYPGKAWLYRDHVDFAGEVDHAELVHRLVTGPWEGWALSTSAEALRTVLGLFPLDYPVRVASWHRGARPGRSGAPRSAWEPVIYRPARDEVREDWPADAFSVVPRARTTDPGRVIGAKPASFAHWIFGLMGARAGDAFDDLYPGSRGMSRAWAVFSQAA